MITIEAPKGIRQIYDDRLIGLRVSIVTLNSEHSGTIVHIAGTGEATTILMDETLYDQYTLIDATKIIAIRFDKSSYPIRITANTPSSPYVRTSSSYSVVPKK